MFTPHKYKKQVFTVQQKTVSDEYKLSQNIQKSFLIDQPFQRQLLVGKTQCLILYAVLFSLSD
jgi:hypothetical protein